MEIDEIVILARERYEKELEEWKKGKTYGQLSEKNLSIHRDDWLRSELDEFIPNSKKDLPSSSRFEYVLY
jgi:hypothetical protein